MVELREWTTLPKSFHRQIEKKYGIDLIPTQIFYDATGKELFRHSGFFAKEDILAKWKELGVDLTGKNGAADSAKSPSPKLSPTK